MKNYFLFFGWLILFQNAQSQTSVGNGDLQVSVQQNGTGAELSSITYNGLEILEQHSYLFYLYITDTTTQTETRISATTGWGQVVLNMHSDYYAIHFANPSNTGLPATLNVNVVIMVQNDTSQWDIEVNGLGDHHTLTRVNFPKFKLKMHNSDRFFIPRFSGILHPDPLATNINYDLTYPRGRLGASMPFSAYINNDDNYLVYLAFHDPTASLKNMLIQAENNYIKYYGKHNIPDKTLAGNDWQLPGVFELDITSGDWYEAAMIYKEWAMNNAPYFPQDTPERMARQHQIGEVSVWGSVQPALNRPVSTTENDIDIFTNLFPSFIPVGIHWYKWNNHYYDDDYPDYFPERTGFVQAVQDIQQNGNHVMPYMNGMLYDTDLSTYPAEGLPYATKDNNGNPYTVHFQDSEPGAPNSLFAFMCPTQAPWQTTLANVYGELANRIQTKGIYVDMVAWAGAHECMDDTHGHPLASGHWWHDGYMNMLTQMHNQKPDTYLTVEGATDDLANVVDGFYVGEWRLNNMVPAFQTVYGGKNQFFGMSYGGNTYDDASFYAKFAYAYVNNIQPGRFYLYFAQDPDAQQARPFIIDIVKMRYKLRDFMSYGEMQKPFQVNGNIPDITSDWGGGNTGVTVPALQKNSYLNTTRDTLAFVFSNASTTNTLNFDFSLAIAQDYGIAGDYDIQVINPDSNSSITTATVSDNIQVDLLPKQSLAYLVWHHQANSVAGQNDFSLHIYPNPVHNQLQLNIDDTDIYNIEVYDLSGKMIIQKKHSNQINVAGLSNGMYILNVFTSQGVHHLKFVKE